MDTDNPYSLNLTPQRGSGITVLGGISNFNKKLIWVTASGSNKKSTKTMLIQIVKASQKNTNTVIVLDNASWHRGKAIKDYLAGKGVTLMFLPSGSSALSPVETVWAQWKQKWRKHLATLKYEELKDINLRKQVREHLAEWSNDNEVSETYESVFKHMLKVMKGTRL